MRQHCSKVNCNSISLLHYRDIEMAFGEDKCGYVYIERGKKTSLGKSIVMNGVTIRELEEGEPYTVCLLDFGRVSSQ